MLGTKPGFYGREVLALNYGPISLAPEVISSHVEMKSATNSQLISSDAYDKPTGQSFGEEQVSVNPSVISREELTAFVEN